MVSDIDSGEIKDAGESSSNTKKRLRLLSFLDVIAVLCLAVFPALVYGIMAYGSSSDAGGDAFFQTDLFLLVVRSIQVAIPILAIMHLTKISWSDYGFVKFKPISDMVVGGVLMVLCLFMYYAIAYFWYFAGIGNTGDEANADLIAGPAFSLTNFLLVLIASLANSFAEELAMRSYMIPRLEEISKSPIFAILATSFMFASYHIYQGMIVVIYAFVIGIVFGVYFHRARRFWPILVAHFFLDAIPFTQMMQQAG